MTSEPFARARPTVTTDRPDLERIAEGMARFHEAMGAGVLADHPFDVLYREAVRFNRDRDFHIAQYRAAGLAPLFSDPAKVNVQSLALLFHLGWTIECDDGGATLFKPDGTAA